MPHGSLIEADLCIIGAGAAGITIARQLIGQPFKVCLFESGGLHMQRETQRLYEGENIGLPYELDTTRTRFFGGSTNCWGGFSRPFEDFHFAERNWVPESGWPISSADLQPYYDRAHEACGIEADAYDPHRVLPGLDGHDLQPLDLPNDRVATRLTRISKKRRCFGKAYREDLECAANVAVYLHANAIELQASPDAGSVAGVRVATLAGNHLQVSARVFILAVGAIENARLLLVSNTVEARGLGNRHDNVGRYFMEHPRSVVAEVTLSPAAERSMKAYLPRYAMLRLPVAAELNVSYEVQKAERLLDSAAYLELVLKGEEAASTMALKQIYWDLWRGVRPRQPMKQLAAILSSPLDVAAFGWGVFSCSERFIRCRRITLISEQCPNPDSRVTLSYQRDRLGVNRVQLDWRMTELDRSALQRTAEILGKELHRAGLLSVTRMMPDCDGEVLAPRWNWHHMGTTRMHENPRRGVVDARCRVHGIANLFVAGSSVFPTAGNHTPTFTIIALAIRLAEHVRSVLSQPPVQLVQGRHPLRTSMQRESSVSRLRAARTGVDARPPIGCARPEIRAPLEECVFCRAD